MSGDNFENKIIEVCSECGTASCWYFEFTCADARDASTELKTVSELRISALENSDNWSDEKMKAVYGESSPHGYKVENNG